MKYSRPKLILFQPNVGAGLCAVGSTIQTCNSGGALVVGDCSNGHNAAGDLCTNGNSNTQGLCQNGNSAKGSGNCQNGSSNVAGMNRLYHGAAGKIR